MTAFLNRIGPKIKIANTLIEKELNKEFGEIFRDYSLTGAQISLMIYLYESKARQITQKEVADAFVLSHPTIRGIVKRLEANKLIVTSRLENDQRQIVLELSNEGFNLIDKNIFKIRTIMTNINKRITKDLSKQEISELEQVLNKISANF
ncbi:MarR family transcriptional regulator [Lactobacillus sp. ESL0260]|uniref:MarR family winged helix-turn-helix transcriptional regulator n=1 Tax=Lactobacillus sp. ESL0260 TaxID=2069347 RepID=UPI000EFA9AA6|nr:MarR family transcriptional regulator [Lactobacillus sp. ESL0260]RMC56463.1 MarR family transcriptional regulator [Lactobacillus sp. ESL0260]